jgi:hypothetical protein
MSLFRRGDVWWHEFWFAVRRIQESSKSPSKTVAKNAEQKRRRELEEGFNSFIDTRQERIRTFGDMAEEYFKSYKLRLPQSARFAQYARCWSIFNEATVILYQNARLGEKASPKSVNEEVGFLLRHPRRSGRLDAHPAPQKKDAQAQGSSDSRKGLYA